MNNFGDIFVYDRLTNETTLISLSNSNTQTNATSEYIPSISDDGSVVAFDSEASNLVAGDTNGHTDVFVRDWLELTPTPTATSTTTRTPTSTNVPGTPTPTPTNTPLIVTPSPTSVPSTSTPAPTSMGIVPSSTPIATDIPITSTATPTTIVPTSPPTHTPTLPPPYEEVYIPLVLRQYVFATPPPVTPTPTPSVTPIPTCEAIDQEQNDVFLEADNNLPLCGSTTVIGSLSITDVNDIYRVESSESGIIQFNLTEIPPNSNFDLYLYNYLRQPIASSIQNGSADEHITVPLSAGRYYIRVVVGQLSAPGTYELRWIKE